MRSLRRILFALPAFGLLLVVPVHAVETDKYLPADADAVVTINVQQILASPLVKEHYLGQLQELLKSNADVQKVLKSVGLDPLKDIDQIILSNGESLYRLTKGVDKGKTVYGSEGGYLFLLKGRFNGSKFRTYGEQLAKEKDSILVKTHMVGTVPLYEIDVGRTLFVGVVDGTTVAVSSRVEPVSELLERAAGKRKTVPKYKELTAALAKLDGKKSIGIAVIGSAGFGLDGEQKKVNGKLVDVPIKQTISQDGLDFINGSIQLTDGIAGDVTVGVKGAAAAKDVAKSVQQDLSDGIDLTFRALVKYPKVGPFLEFIKSVNVTVKDNRTVTIKASVTAQQVAEALK